MKNIKSAAELPKSMQVVVEIYRKAGSGARTVYYRPQRETLEDVVRALFPTALAFKYANKIVKLKEQ